MDLSKWIIRDHSGQEIVKAEIEVSSIASGDNRLFFDVPAQTPISTGDSLNISSPVGHPTYKVIVIGTPPNLDNPKLKQIQAEIVAV